MPWLADTHLQNTRERVKQNGSAAELLRHMYLDELKSHRAAFYEHGSFAEVTALCMTFNIWKRGVWSAKTPLDANLIETIFTLFGRGAHKRRPKPGWPLARETLVAS